MSTIGAAPSVVIERVGRAATATDDELLLELELLELLELLGLLGLLKPELLPAPLPPEPPPQPATSIKTVSRAMPRACTVEQILNIVPP